MRRFFLPLWAMAVLVGSTVAQTPIPPDLKAYVDQKDDSFTWKLRNKTESDAGTLYTIDLISQTWHGVKWDHGLVVVVPKGSHSASTMLLWNQGGAPSAGNNALCIEIARRVNSPCAFLFGIPKQPLFGGKKEDALIAETFVRFLATKDSTWPLLFPMVKSMVRTMDCLQAFCRSELKTEVTSFVVTGASKRGWTSWLTAATGDKRVKAIAPMVIDTLNMQKQMPHQLESFGRYSDQIHDYEERKLLPMPKTAEARRLWTMVDPWMYRANLTLPKMIINGTNDPYWAQDALNLYWDDLKGEKYVCYVPNAGHGLRPEEHPNVRGTKMDLFPMRAINCLAG
ncbi:MAG TPA: PhoPQ-activated protein PqaA family protein, partial [Fimbriiglobus sp.]